MKPLHYGSVCSGFDQKAHGRPHAVAEWKTMWENKRMPTQKKCDAILAAHNAAAPPVDYLRS